MNSIRGKPATALFVVSFAVFVDLMVYGLMIPVLPGYATGLGASRGTLGLLVGSFGIAVVVATPLFGVLTDRYGNRWPMVGGLLAFTASTLLFAYAPGLAWLFAAQALQGVSSAARSRRRLRRAVALAGRIQHADAGYDGPRRVRRHGRHAAPSGALPEVRHQDDLVHAGPHDRHLP